MEANQHYLMAEVHRIRSLLQAVAARDDEAKQQEAKGTAERQGEIRVRKTETRKDLTPPAALEKLCHIFNLSDFERDIVLLCVATELDSSFASLCATAQKNPQRPSPTFSLALAFFPDAHWSALTPSAPLRYWRLLNITPSETLVTSPLHIDEQILHYLTGLQHLHEQLRGYIRPLPFSAYDRPVPSHDELAEKISASWSNPAQQYPLVQIFGADLDGRRQVALLAAKRAGFNVHLIVAEALPSSPPEFDQLLRLWERQAVLANSVLLVDCENIDHFEESKRKVLNTFVEEMRDVVIVSAPEPLYFAHRRCLTYEVSKPTREEQQALWEEYLSPAGLKGNIRTERFVSQFNLSGSKIRDVCEQGFSEAADDSGGKCLEDKLWTACRRQTRPKLQGLAQRIQTLATWDDLVLPSNQLHIMHDIIVHVRQRTLVYDQWGFRRKSARGLGISALFSGPSGTGKTMAAEVLAGELDLDLYRIDLSQVVSKYIGETEKNLRRVFDGAEDSAAILLFDEADALFGKRSEVKDSHDRYANIEVSYLLQRMESYRGLAILTTNLKEAIDDAFTRRIRFMVSFPFPGLEAREQIWTRIFPEQTPTGSLDIAKLAQLNITGGNIYNIALHAAFRAADKGESVGMAHLLRAVRSEYVKIEKPLVDSEIQSWL